MPSLKTQVGSSYWFILFCVDHNGYGAKNIESLNL